MAAVELNTKKKTSAMILMIEQMIETKAWKEVRGLTGNIIQCKLCKEWRGSATSFGWMQNVSKYIRQEYLAKHNRALMVMAVVWAKELNLSDNQNVKWYLEKCNRGHVLELCMQDFEFNLQKITRSRRPHLMLEEKQIKINWTETSRE